MNKLYAVLAALVLCLMGAPAFAANCSPYTYTFSNGTVADATQVNANFTTIINCANLNLAKNGINADITQLTGLTTPLVIAEGGTGSATAAGALTNLGALPLAGGTMTGKLTTVASATGAAGFSILPGVAPTSPVNGDIWATTQTLNIQLGGATSGIALLNRSNTFSQPQTFPAGTTGGPSINLPPGVAPSVPTNGDIWTTSGGMFARINGVTQTLGGGCVGTCTFTGSNTLGNANSNVQTLQGHVATPGGTPTSGNCTGIAGNDTHGSASMSTTNCTITFANGWASAPDCVIGGNATVSITFWTGTITTTTMVVRQSGSGAVTFTWICLG